MKSMTVEKTPHATIIDAQLSQCATHPPPPLPPPLPYPPHSSLFLFLCFVLFAYLFVLLICLWFCFCFCLFFICFGLVFHSVFAFRDSATLNSFVCKYEQGVACLHMHVISRNAKMLTFMSLTQHALYPKSVCDYLCWRKRAHRPKPQQYGDRQGVVTGEPRPSFEKACTLRQAITASGKPAPDRVSSPVLIVVSFTLLFKRHARVLQGPV